MSRLKIVAPVDAPDASEAADRSGSKSPGKSASPGAGPEIVLLDAQGVIVAVNHAWRSAAPVRRLGAARSGVGAPYVGVALHFLPHLEPDRFHAALAELRSGERDQIHYAYAVETQRGPRWRQVQITPLALGEELRFVAIHEDLTELVRAQEALRRTSEQLLNAQDDERQRIAIELHDSTSQHLAALGLGLTRLKALSVEPKARTVLAEMSRSLEEAVKETRVLSYLMKPTGLIQERLVTTARRFVEGFARRTGLEIAFQASGPVDDASAPVQHAAFRIVQESLSNVYRHAGAHRATVDLEAADQGLTVRVTDDGCGIHPTPPGASDPPLGVGITGMRARVAQLGGRLSITSDETGTRVLATFPA